MLLLFPAALACTLHAEEVALPNLEVHTLDETISVSIRDSTVLAELAETTRLVVRSPLLFYVDRPLASLPLRTATSLSLYHSVLTVPPGVSIEPDASTLGPSTVEVRLPPRELRTPVALPCDALTLDASRRAPPLQVEPETMRDTTWLHGPTPFRASRFHSDPWTAEVRGPVHVEVRRPGWLQLAAIWDDGTEIRGWVETRHTYTPQIRRRAGYGIPGSARYTCGRSHPPRLEPRHVRAGTAVHVRAGGPAWATYTEDSHVEVFPDGPDGWVRIAHSPGLVSPACGELEVAWVRAERVVSAEPSTQHDDH